MLRRLVVAALPSALVGRLRGWRVRQVIAGYQPRVVEHRYGSGPLRVHLTDPMAAGWYDHDWPELPEVESLRGRTLKAGTRVFDIGAHHGVVALMLAREVGSSGEVIAVEANPHNAATAVRNRDLNGMSQVQIVQAAAADREGTVIFNEGLDGQIDDGTGAGGRMTVAAVTLDGLATRYGPPDLVFLDVEGAECLVLAGGSTVLNSDADWAIEVHVSTGLEKLGGSVERLLSFLPGNRYTLLVRAEADTRFRPLQKNDPLLQERFFLLALCRAKRES